MDPLARESVRRDILAAQLLSHDYIIVLGIQVHMILIRGIDTVSGRKAAPIHYFTISVRNI